MTEGKEEKRRRQRRRVRITPRFSIQLANTSEPKQQFLSACVCARIPARVRVLPASRKVTGNKAVLVLAPLHLQRRHVARFNVTFIKLSAAAAVRRVCVHGGCCTCTRTRIPHFLRDNASAGSDAGAATPSIALQPSLARWRRPAGETGRRRCRLTFSVQPHLTKQFSDQDVGQVFH